MKVIDLLNKIANGEEVPKKIKWEDTIFAYSDYDKDYLEFPFSEEEYQGLFCMKDSILTQYLNDEVEIIEEDKKIEKNDTGLDSGRWDEESVREKILQGKNIEDYLIRVMKELDGIKFKVFEIIDYLNNDTK